ncbi:MAG: hypothetical protein GDA48_05630, partial [Hormoscilla sp. GM102CHS1]|nr:hypothetical protein [Hormoscilla sp. GM102CHS1]
DWTIAETAPNYIVKFIGHLLDKLHRDRGFADTSHAQNCHQATAFRQDPLFEGSQFLGASVERGDIRRIS